MTDQDRIRKELAEFKLARKSLAEKEKTLKAEAKEKGIKLTSEKIPDTSEIKLLKDSFLAVIDANADLIFNLFEKTKTAEKEFGNDYLSFSLSEKFAILIQDKSVKVAKANSKKVVA